AELKKKAAPGLQGPLEEAVRRRIETHSLPAAVGCLLQKKKWLVFLVGDVVGGSPQQPGAVSGVQPAEPFHFARAFDEAFERLEKQPGAHNFVNLADLRRALPVDRPSFDAELSNLRRAGRYTLS